MVSDGILSPGSQIQAPNGELIDPSVIIDSSAVESPVLRWRKAACSASFNQIDKEHGVARGMATGRADFVQYIVKRVVTASARESHGYSGSFYELNS